MTTSTTGQVGHLSEEVTAMEIDGFRGQLITADHPDDHTARAGGMAPSTGAPG